MVNLIKTEFKELVYDLKKIVKNKKILIIWIFILPFNILIILFIYLYTIVWYFKFLTELITKIIVKKIYKIKKIKKYIKPIKIKEEKIIIKNFLIRDLKNLIVRKSYKKAFYILYLQILTIKEIKNKKKNIINIIKKFIDVFLYFIFRKVIFFLTSLPYIVIKNNNKIAIMINSILKFKTESKKEYLYTILLNLKIRYVLELDNKTKKLKIHFNKKKIFLNPPKNIYDKANKILSKFNNKNLFKDSIKIFSQEIIYLNASIKYVENGEIKFVKNHPTAILEQEENQNEKEMVLAVNETTKEHIKYNTNLYKKLEIKSRPFFEELTNKKIAYKVLPYEIEKELLILKNNKEVNEAFENPENKIKKLVFIQAFFFNLSKEMFIFDMKNKLITDKNYINMQEYFEKNIDKFDDNKKEAIEKMLEFYIKNKDKFINEKDNFLNLIYQSTIDKETKEFFLNFLDKN